MVKKCLKIFPLLIGLLLFAQTTYAQEFQLVMEMVVTNDGKKMDGATIELRKNGQLVNTFTTDSRGAVDVPVGPDGNYEIAISGPGMIKKKLEVNTSNIPAEDAKGTAYFPAEVNIFPKVEGLNYAILDQPIGKIRYDPDFGGFDADLDYTKRQKAALDKLQDDYEKQKANEAKLAAQKQKDYDAAIKAADKAFNSEQWELAEQEYKKAAAILPIETYPSFQLAELETKLIKIRETNAKYDEAIKLADAAFASKDYQKAMAEYKRASSYKPDEAYPKDKAKESQDLLAAAAKRDQTYLAAIERGDNALKINDLNTAKTAFEEATAAKPEETYPKNKLAEINDILGKQQAKEAEYQAAIKAADEALASKDYGTAKTNYQKALGVKPTESYPQEQISKVDELLAAEAARDQNYLAAVEKGDNALQQNDLQTALAAFGEASKIKPEETYPTNKIKEINDLIAKNEAKDKEYQDKIKEADKLLASESYAEAKTAYEAAAGLKPTESYPKEKIGEIEGILAANAEKEKKYNDAIAVGDKAYESKDYAAAKEAYTTAKGVKPDEKYPQDQLAAIGTILVKMEESQAKYDEAIKNGDEAFAAQDLDAAAKFYEEAKTLKAEESYPQTKLDEIAAIVAKKAEQEKAYNDAIAAGDAAMKEEKLEDAKAKYTEAKGIKPEESYPQEQISKIDGMLANAAKLEEDYKAAIAKGDEAFAAKNYSEAITAYQEASGKKPNESYPKEKFAEAEGLIKASEEKEAQYAAAIKVADKAFQAENFEEAKKSYEEALTYKDDQYPKDQIAAADEKIAALAAAQAEAEKLEADYQAALTEGQSKFDAEDYAAALIAYQSAAALKPDEKMPKDKIAEVEAKQKELAEKKAEEERLAELEKQYNEKIAAADQAYKDEKFKDARAAYQEALAIKAEESYPKEKIDEINGLLADAAEQDELYAAAIAEGDKLFGKEDYEGAKAKYQEASSIKSEESYPKDKIGEIDLKLAALAAAAAEIRLKKEKEEAKRQEYEQLLSEGDALASESEFNQAIGKYEAALNLFDEQTPKDKIEEMKAKIAERDAQMAAAEKAEIEEKYNALIAEADALFSSEDFSAATAKYKEALTVKDDQYPKDQIAAIEAKQAELANAKEAAEKAAQYQALIDAADALYSSEDLTGAISKYKEALTVKDDQYPKDQIAAIEAKQAELAGAKEEAKKAAEYQALIAEADGLLEAEQLDEAEAKYEAALDVLDRQYPKDQIEMIKERRAEIASKQAKLAAAAELEENYRKVITAADLAFQSKNYREALSKYEEAVAIKEGDPHPVQRIEVINSYLAEENAKNQKENQYAAAIAAGDAAMNASNYEQAKSEYQKALSIKGEEQYPKDQIAKADEMIAKANALAAAEAEEIRLKREAEAQNEAAYQTAVAEGDQLMSAKKYDEAINKYELALGLKPSKSYPAEQIQKARQMKDEDLLAAKRRAKEAEDREKRYLEIIASANKSFNGKDYQFAKREYEAALAMKPGEAYPKARIKEIESILRGNQMADVKEEVKDEPIKIQKGPKASITGDAEAEIDKLYKEMWAKRNVDKNAMIVEKREVVKKFTEEEQEKDHAKRQNAIERLDNISISLAEQRQSADELHLQNFETVQSNTKSIRDKEIELTKGSERKRNENMSEKERTLENIEKNQHDKHEELVTGKKEMVEEDYEEQEEFRKELSGIQYEKIEQLDEEFVQKEETVRNFNKERSDVNHTKNSEDLKQKEEDWKESVTRYSDGSYERTDKEKEKIYQKDIDIREFAKERNDQYLEGYKKVMVTTEDQEEFIDANNESSADRRMNEQEKISDIATDIRSRRMEGSQIGNDNYIKVVEKTDALKDEDISLSEESESRRQEALKREFYEGEDKPRQDPESANHPQGISENIIENDNGSTTIRRTVVEGTETNVYEKTLYPWGGVFYTRNGSNITKEAWDSESK